MIFDGLRSGSGAAEGGCRRMNDSAEVVEKPSNSFRRKRMELRRVRSLSLEKSAGDSDHKKKRSEGKKLMENSLVVQLPEDGGAVVGGSGELACLSHGTISVIGRRREMEDAVAVELGFVKRGGRSYDFFGVFDGHGGCSVANACSEMMHKVVAEVVGGESGEEVNWGEVMAAGFRKVDEEVNKAGGAAVATTGSTAVVAVVGVNELVVANCGDSRAVLARDGAAVQLSDDHKPDRPDELERIELNGGKVINWNGQRVLGVLATSRSIGDEYLKPFVIPDPEVKVINRTSTDEFLILASDGLWDVISNDIACQVVRRCLEGQIKRNNKSRFSQFQGNTEGGSLEEIMNEGSAAEAAAVLAELAMARGSRDNISVIVVGLKSFSVGQFGEFSS